jgi:hypothetical protein
MASARPLRSQRGVQIERLARGHARDNVGRIRSSGLHDAVQDFTRDTLWPQCNLRTKKLSKRSDTSAREAFANEQAPQPAHVRAIVHLRQIDAVARIERAIALSGRSYDLVERRVSGLPFAIRSANSPIASGGHVGNDGIKVLGMNRRRRALERSFSGQSADHLLTISCNNATLDYTAFWSPT